MTTGEGEARTYGDRYVLGERIAVGPQTEVWRAHDDIVSRQVALKIFFGEQAKHPGWRKSFREIANRLVALSHPGIAKVYEYGDSATETWLATAFVRGEPLPAIIDAGPPLTARAALDLVGQTAIALQAAHDAGVVHGNLVAANLLVRGNPRSGDAVVALIGFAMPPDTDRSGDLSALGDLAHDLLRDSLKSPDLPPDVYDFLSWLTDPDRATPPNDAGDIGRTALALTASLSGRHETTVVPSARSSSAMMDSVSAPPRYDEAERKRVRNRLIILGAIVVIGGGVLLRFIGEGGGQLTVPNEIGLPLNQAQLNLTSAGFRINESAEVSPNGSGGTVVSQSPPAGVELKAGSTVTLTIGESGGR